MLWLMKLLGSNMFRIIGHTGHCGADFAKPIAPKSFAPHCRLFLQPLLSLPPTKMATEITGTLRSMTQSKWQPPHAETAAGNETITDCGTRHRPPCPKRRQITRQAMTQHTPEIQPLPCRLRYPHPQAPTQHTPETQARTFSTYPETHATPKRQQKRRMRQARKMRQKPRNAEKRVKV